MATETQRAGTDPALKAMFAVEIDGLAGASFKNASEPSASKEVVTYRDGDDPPRFKKFDGLETSENVKLTSLVKGSRRADLYAWWKSGDRRSCAILTLDNNGETIGRVELYEAWICVWSGTEHDSEAAGDKLELEIEIAYDDFDEKF